MVRVARSFAPVEPSGVRTYVWLVLTIERYISVEIFKPPFTYLLVVEHNKIQYVSELPFVKLASVACEDASSVACQPYLGGVGRWLPLGNMNMNWFAILCGPEIDGEALKQI